MSFRPTPRNRGARHYHLAAGCLLAALSCAVPLFADPTYTFIQVPGAVATYPTSINLFGAITGDYYDGTRNHGFVRDPSGTITTFNVPGSNFTLVWAINAAGTVVGYWADANGFHSFMRDSKGTITAFDPPACGQSFAYRINAEGAILGYCTMPNDYVRDPGGTFHMFQGGWPAGINNAYLVTGSEVSTGFVGWPSDNLLTTFRVGNNWTTPTGINSFGAVVGYYLDSAVMHMRGFVRGPLGKIVSFDAAASSSTSANAINDAGAIVGYYDDSNGRHGFVRDPQGAITSFDPPGSKSTIALSVNDLGVITGYFSTDGGKTSAGFVRTP